jgi:hypothetical protein
VKDDLKKRYESISVMLNSFSFARIQEYYSLILTLNEFKISEDEFMAWVRFRRIEGSKAGSRGDRSYHCPDCGKVLGLFKVNDKPCSDVGDGYKTLFSCFDSIGCGYSRYSVETVESWILVLKNMSKPGAMSKMLSDSIGCGGCGSK